MAIYKTCQDHGTYECSTGHRCPLCALEDRSQVIKAMLRPRYRIDEGAVLWNRLMAAQRELERHRKLNKLAFRHTRHTCRQ